MSDPENDEEKKKDLKLIHGLAHRLPWIVIGVVVLAVLATIIQLLFTKS